MKLLQFYKNGVPALGIKTDKGIVDVSANRCVPKTMLELCQKGNIKKLESLDGPIIDEKDIKYAPVITGMEKILCVGLNYRKHAIDAGIPIPEKPTLFCKFANALAACGDTIKCPKDAVEIDYEAELVYIIGADGKPFAVTCGNDLSVREWQTMTSQWIIGKSQDQFGPIGPYAVTVDCINHKDLAIGSRVNGETKQASRTSDMIFDIDEVLEFLDGKMTLKPGDIIFMGTPSGTMLEHKKDNPVWLKPGDVVEIEIEGIGALKNQFE